MAREENEDWICEAARDIISFVEAEKEGGDDA